MRRGGGPPARRRAVSVAFALALILASAPRMTADEGEIASSRLAALLAEAHGAGDATTFERLVQSARERAWDVADELLGQGRGAVARALAAQVGGPGSERLSAFLRDYADPPEDGPVRRALGRAEEALQAGDGATLAALVVPPGPPTVARARLLLLLAAASLDAGDPGAARPKALGAATAAEAAGWWEGAAEALALGAEGASAQGDWLAARDLWQALAEREAGWAPAEEQATTRANHGRTLGMLGLHGEAIRACEEGLAILGTEGGEEIRAFLLWTLGRSHARRGAWRASLGALDDALRAYEAIGDPVGAANVGVELAKTQRAMGLDEEAVASAEAAAARLRDARPEDAAPALATLATVLAEGGWLAEGAARLAEADRLYGVLGDERNRARVETARSDVALRQGRAPEALGAAERALAAQRRSGDREGEVASRANRADALAALGLPEAAWEEGLTALRLARDLERPDLVLDLVERVAAQALQAGRTRKALALANAGIERLGDLFAGLSEVESARARSHRAPLVTTGVRAARARGDLPSLLRMIEASRSRALLDSLGGLEATRDASVRTDLLEEETRSRATVARLRAQIVALRADDRPVPQALRRELREAMAAGHALTERIRRDCRAGAGLARPALPTQADLRRLLGSEGALVAYLTEAACCGALVVDLRGLRWVDLEDERVRRAVEALRPMDTAKDFDAALEALREALVEPLGLGPQTRQVVICPEGPLYRVPFAALLPERVVAEVPSGAVLVALAARPSGEGRGVLALGDPTYPAGSAVERLPASAAEARELAREAEDALLLAADATEGALRSRISRPVPWAAVHLACHGLVDDDLPVESALLLTPEGADDGRWTLLEILRTPVDADLVVLSACEGAGGRVLPGEGLLGLTTAFLCAGAPRVVASLWPVEDEATARFMRAFHGHRRAGVPAAEALRRAQADLRQTHPHKRHWAGWVLWGRPD